MMFTPLIFIIVDREDNGFLVNPFALMLVLTSLVLLIKWELTYRMHPERFSDVTNLSIRCENCTEKLCSHKKQLQKLLRKSRELLRQKIIKKGGES